MTENIDIEKELRRLGYWNDMYSKENAFGTGPTKLAIYAEKIMNENKVRTVLELGCGQGRDSLFFAEKGYQVTAIDFSKNAVNYVKKIIEQNEIENIDVKLQDIVQLDLDHKFDCIYSNLALQFFNQNQLSDIFKKVSRMLHEDQVFIFSTKKPGDKYHNVGRKINEKAFMTNDIVRYFFDKGEIEEMLKPFFEIETLEEEDHTNADGSKSVWWYSVVRNNNRVTF